MRYQWTHTLLVASTFVLLFDSSARAASLTLEWDPPTDTYTSGYIVLYGTASGVYASSVDVGFVTRYRVDGLDSGTTYFFAVQAYNSSGDMSELSLEVAEIAPGSGPPPGGGSQPPGGGGSQSPGGGGSQPPSGGSSTPPSGAPGTAPSNLTARLRDRLVVDLNWQAPTARSASGYRVEIGTASGHTALTTFTTGLTSSFRVTDLGAAAYFIRVRSMIGGTVGEASNETVISADNGPTAPRAFTARRVGRRARVNWQPPADGLGATSYRIEIGSAAGNADIRTELVSGTSSDIPELPGGTYFLRVRGLRTSGLAGASSEAVVTAPSNEATVTIPEGSVQCTAPPGAPVRFIASSEGSLVQLSWQEGGGDSPTGYLLHVGTAPGAQDILTVPFGSETTQVSATASNGTYALRLLAVNACGASPWGPEAALNVGTPVGTGEPLPAAPRGLTQQVTGSLATLTWMAPTTGGAVTRYLIEATTPAGTFTFDTGSTLTTLTNANTAPGEYVVRVRAGNATGFGPASAPVTVVVRP